MTSAVPQDQSSEQAWAQEDGEDVDAYIHVRDKGKQRQMNDEVGDAQSEASPDPSANPYPPMNDDEIETRRVEENLRRWEVAERKRRKAARESSQTAPATSSLLDDIARRANQIWPNRQNRHSGLGAHTALQSQENIDAVPLDNIHDPTSSSSPSPSPSPSRTSSQDTLRENPFTNPPEVMSPFTDPPNPEPSTPLPSATRSSPSSKYLDLPPISRRRPPVPKPLDLPKPRTPPPVASLPYANTSSAVAEEHLEVSDERETRWWHDWLCGCGEGPDRGGEHQAGRTNPFE